MGTVLNKASLCVCQWGAGGCCGDCGVDAFFQDGLTVGRWQPRYPVDVPAVAVAAASPDAARVRQPLRLGKGAQQQALHAVVHAFFCSKGFRNGFRILTTALPATRLLGGSILQW